MSRPSLDPDLLRAFLVTVDERSFTRAARQLARTQSAVSMQIKRLETRLGTTLLNRTTVGVDLSPAGERFLADARRLLDLHDAAVDRVRADRIEGHIRLGVMDDYGTLVVPPLLSGFAARHPGVRVTMETGLTATMVDRIGRDFDLVIAMHPEGTRDGMPLRREPAIWVASANHPVETAEPLPVALYPPGCLFRSWATAALDQAGRTWRLAFVSHSLSAVAAVVEQGLAVTVVKAGTCPARLRRLGERDGLPSLPVAEIRLHAASGLSQAGTLLADHFRETIR